MRRKLVLLVTLAILVVGMLSFTFRVQRVEASGTITIMADGSIDPPTAPIQRNGSIYTLTANITTSADPGIAVERDDMTLDGAGSTLQGTGIGTGIRLQGRRNVTITNTKIKKFYRGICLTESSSNSISENNITNNDYASIQLYMSSNYNSIYGNNITNNGDGILLSSFSKYNSICGNNIIANDFHGIWLSDSSNNNIFGNDITNNADGLFLQSSSNNSIYHNNFVNNTKQVYIHTSGYANFWDNGTEGNYWSDYTGIDRNGDGIGNTPYVIDENNQDNYPLIRSPFEHELATSIRAPTSITQLGVPISLNATVTNRGSSNENNTELVLLIDGAITDSKIIPFLKSCDSYTLSYLWTPTVRGIYNVTAYVYPILGEVLIENNQNTKFITVCPIGVKAGDWIKYEYTYTNVPSGTPLPQWLKVEFLSVEETTVTLRLTMHMSNGTEGSETFTLDIARTSVYNTGGTFDTFFGFGFVIPANSTVEGDFIYLILLSPKCMLGKKIEGETTRTYVGASITGVYATFSYIGGRYGTLRYYWDKQTGVMVEVSATLKLSAALDGMTAATAKVAETNIWEAAPSGLPIEPTVLYALIVVIIAIVVAVVFFTIRRKKKPPEVESPQSQKPAHTHNGDNE